MMGQKLSLSRLGLIALSALGVGLALNGLVMRWDRTTWKMSPASMYSLARFTISWKPDCVVVGNVCKAEHVEVVAEDFDGHILPDAGHQLVEPHLHRLGHLDAHAGQGGHALAQHRLIGRPRQAGDRKPGVALVHPAPEIEHLHVPPNAHLLRARLEEVLRDPRQQALQALLARLEQLVQVRTLAHAQPRGSAFRQRIAVQNDHLGELPRQRSGGAQPAHARADHNRRLSDLRRHADPRLPKPRLVRSGKSGSAGEFQPPTPCDASGFAVALL